MKKEEFLDNIERILRDSISAIMEKAYDIGYEQGKEDAKNENKPIDEQILREEIVWYDFGLPSGNLWSLVDRASVYKDSIDIATEEELKELVLCIRTAVWVSSGNNFWPSLKIIGLNGRELSLQGYSWWNNTESSRHSFNDRKYKIHIWCKSKLDENLNHSCITIVNGQIPTTGRLGDGVYNVDWQWSSLYSGDKAFILICKKK